MDGGRPLRSGWMVLHSAVLPLCSTHLLKVDDTTGCVALKCAVFTARCYACAVLAVGLCPCLSQVGVLLKRLDLGSHKQQSRIGSRMRSIEWWHCPWP